MKLSKLKSIIELSEKTLGLKDFEIEVEYQSDTIGKYTLEFNNSRFSLFSVKTACFTENKENLELLNSRVYLFSVKTACLAKDQCGIPERPTIQKSTVQNTCPPSSSCC